ncbi:uncharacterized protein LOC133530884 [Cydia pomonella]|uniref:uncharacterized protein LOC133530884 n=1 Tax=Cydia pomonella TaxID=82600 RepID=UPI002ADDADA5|nr:uncharacterized protein LOC133530884 [Cydia pomonella]
MEKTGGGLCQLVAQVVTQKLSDTIKAEVKKRVIQGTDDGPDADADGVNDDDEAVEQLDTEGDQPVEDYQGVDDDEATLNDDGSSAMTLGKGYGNGKGNKKTLCIYTPENLQYCVSQAKEL